MPERESDHSHQYGLENTRKLRSLAWLLIIIILSSSAPLFAFGRKEPSRSTPSLTEHHEEDGDSLESILPVIRPSGSRLRVLATTSILGDVVQAVAKDTADVTVLMAPGQNPHSFEPAPGDLLRIEQADLLFINGFDLEENLLDDIRTTATSPIIAVSAGIPPLTPSFEEDDHHEAIDPHVWMDPRNVIFWVERIIAALSAADPEHAELYRLHGDTYIEALNQLDAEIRTRIESIPLSSRKLVVDHSSFTYFADSYGFEIIGAIIPGVSDTREPSARDIASLVDLIRSAGVRAVFVAQTASRGLQSLARSVTDEVGEEVVILPTLTGALSPRGQRGDGYMDLLRFTVEQIVKGLGEGVSP